MRRCWRGLARLRFCECLASAAWLTALPMAPTLAMKDGEFGVAMQHRLGLTPLPANAVGLRFPCRSVTNAADCDHTMTWASSAGKAMLRHDILKGILRRAIYQAGIASSLEPTLRRLLGLEAGARSGATGSAAGLEARGDILMALEAGLAIVGVSGTHPPGVANWAAAARTDGAAADGRDREKRRAYSRLESNGYPFTPFSVESYGRLGKPAMDLLSKLGEEAESAGRQCSKAQFVSWTLRELSGGR